jgi:uncharacterized protein YgiM (DUF1202 family)
MAHLSRAIPFKRRTLASLALAFALLVGLVGLIPQRAAAADFASGDTVNTTDELNLRSDAGTDGTVREVLPKGTELTIVQGPRSDDGLEWYQVTVVDSGAKGWVAADYIEDANSDNSTGFDDALGVRVADGPVNVRESAGLDAVIKTTLDTGFEVPVYGAGTVHQNADGHQWIKVLYGNGIQGWIATDYLTPLTYAPNLGSWNVRYRHGDSVARRLGHGNSGWP